MCIGADVGKYALFIPEIKVNAAIKRQREKHAARIGQRMDKKDEICWGIYCSLKCTLVTD